jgi:pteridine reductase
MPSLTGQTALVTGGAVRVGAAISRAVSAAGAKLAIHCHNHRDEAQRLAEELSTPEAPARVFQADLVEDGAVRCLFDAVEAELGPVSLVVNNAGLIAVSPFNEFDAHLARTLFELNALVPMRMMAELARREPAQAVVINIVDSAVDTAWVEHAAYLSSKSALLSASRVAALELAPRIRVNVVNPGTVVLRPDELPRVDELIDRVPLGRIGSPDEIGRAVVFLATTTYANGVVLDIDGGTRLK